MQAQSFQRVIEQSKHGDGALSQAVCELSHYIPEDEQWAKFVASIPEAAHPAEVQKIVEVWREMLAEGVRQ